MVKNNCQCAERTFNPDSEVVPVKISPAIPHRQAQMPSVLKYRGLDTEAAEAARAVKIASLMATLQAALDDLDLSVVDLLAPETDAKQIRQR